MAGMDDAPGDRSRRILAGFLAAACVAAVAVLLSAQLALMSVLDPARAEDAATEVAESRFAGDLIDQTVRRAVEPFVDGATADQVAAATADDPRVRRIVRATLVNAHLQVIDPDAAALTRTVTDEPILDALEAALADAGAAAGVDLSAATSQLGSPAVLPDELPDVGLRPIAETVRFLAALAAVVLAVATVVVHPRPGRALAGLGWKVAVVFGVWLLALLVVGRVIDRIAETLFGEVLEAVWSASVPSMVLLCAAGLVLAGGVWMGGVALDGFVTDRRRRRDAAAAW